MFTCVCESDSKEPYPPLITATNPLMWLPLPPSPLYFTSSPPILPHSFLPFNSASHLSSMAELSWSNPLNRSKTSTVFSCQDDGGLPIWRLSLLELASGQVYKKAKVSGVSAEKEAHLNRLRPMPLFKALTLNAAWMRGDVWYESYKIWFWMFKRLWKYLRALRIMGVQKGGNKHVSIAISVLNDWLPNAFFSQHLINSLHQYKV